MAVSSTVLSHSIFSFYWMVHSNEKYAICILLSVLSDSDVKLNHLLSSQQTIKNIAIAWSSTIYSITSMLDIFWHLILRDFVYQSVWYLKIYLIMTTIGCDSFSNTVYSMDNSAIINRNEIVSFMVDLVNVLSIIL